MTGDELEDLVAEFVERRDAGEDIDPHAFAFAHPTCADALLALLQRVARTEAMFPSDDASCPRFVGPWQIVCELGRGGMGRVYEVVHRDGGPPRALKQLHVHSTVDARAVERFRREAEALRDFTHGGVCRVHEVGESDGATFLVMDLIEGPSLADLIARAAHAPSERSRVDHLDLPGSGTGAERAAALVAELARTLAAAHRQGLVHRDLKPSNVLLRADGSPVVIDFGLARRSDAATLTGTGDVLGTPHFMAPEQANGRVGDARVDVYGLGAILYQLLTLETPYPGSEPVAVLSAVRRAPPRPPRALDPFIPHPLSDVVRRAMAFRPARRFANADAMADALEACARSARPKPTALPLVNRFEDAARRHRRWIIAADLVVLAAIVTLILQAVVVPRPRDQRVAESIGAGSRAWLRGDREAARAAGMELIELGDDRLGGYFARLGEHEMPAADTDPVLIALHEGDAARAVGDHAAARDAYRRARTLGGPAALLDGLEGLAAVDAGDDATALRALEIALRTFPDVARLHVGVGTVHERTERWILAAASLQRAAELRDDDADLWHRAGRNWTKAGDGSAAIAALRRALELSDDPLYERTLAAAIDLLGDSERAIEILSGLVERLPRRPTLLHNLGVAYHGAHQLVDASRSYAMTLELEPDHVDTLVLEAWIRSGSDADCAQCAAELATHPILLDPARAEDCMLRALAADRGRRSATLETLTSIARRLGREEALARGIDELMDRRDLGERALGRLAKALQHLR